jgi:hypothetical protein
MPDTDCFAARRNVPVVSSAGSAEARFPYYAIMNGRIPRANPENPSRGGIDAPFTITTRPSAPRRPAAVVARSGGR